MKKYSILVAAFAMLAFAGCNKEEQHDGMVALNFGGEAFVSNDKQAYQNNNILFTAGDQAYVNGEVADVNPVGTGRYGKIFAHATADGVFDIHYPVSTVRYDAATSRWKTTFLRNINLIPAMGNTIITGDGYQVWPMSSYIADINAGSTSEGSVTPQYTLYNNVAILSPAVKYGPDFAEAMWSDGGVDDLDWIRDDDNLPTLTITKVVISSSQITLTGDATLQNLSAEDMADGVVPYYVMDNAPAADSIVATVSGTGFAAVPTTSTASGVITVAFGNIPIAPYYRPNKHFTVAYYFNATVGNTTGSTTHYYKYSVDIATSDFYYFARSGRTNLVANFYNQTVAALSTKVAIRTTPFGE